MSIETFVSEFSNYDLGLHGVRLPSFDIDVKYKKALGVPLDASNFEFLRGLCLQGFKKLKLDKNSADYKTYTDRVKYELDILKELEFVDYIILVWDVINFCKENRIPVGLGRGSAAGSLVLYLIGVTRIDPIKYGLYFERFISKFRAKKQVIDGVTYLDGSLMCDIDMDICYYNRPKVIAYLEERFKGRTCKISTLNTLQGKLLIKECGKIIAGKSEEEVKLVANMIPELFGKVRDIEIAYEGEKNAEGKWKYEPIEEFKKWCDEHRDVYECALKLRGLVKNKSVHASAMLLSYYPLEESCPVDRSSNKEAVCSYDMSWATVTNLKLDILGLRAVSVVDDVCKQIGIDIEDIDFNDPIIYQNLQDLKSPHGIFQIEADTVFRACKKIKPLNLEHLSGVMAVARPGAMQFIDQYATYTTTGVAGSIHPFFDDTLGGTGGLALYQEQLMRMVHKIGFTLDEAEIVRRVVGKKKVKEMAEWEEKVKKKVEESKLDPAISPVLWKVMDASKDYSFNKSHSIAYAALAATTIYLKFKYPTQFFLSLLKMTRHEPDPISEISKIHKELAHFNIALLPPDIISSDLDFKIEGSDIRFGLLSIKGIADKSIQKLLQFRKPMANKFEVFKGAEEAKLGLGILSALIQAGALEEFRFLQGNSKAGISRSRVVLEAQIWSLLTDTEKKWAMHFGPKPEFNFDLPKVIKHLLVAVNEKGKPIIKASRFETIKRKYTPYLEIYQQNKKNEAFANWYYERKLIGYAYFTTLKEVFQGENRDIMSIKEVKATPPNEDVIFVGVVTEQIKSVSKKGTKYLKLIVQDEAESLTCMTFDTGYELGIEKCRENNDGKLPQEGNVVIIKGVKKDDDTIFTKMIGIQDLKVFTRLGELKSLDDKKEAKEEKALTKNQNSEKITV